MAIRIALSALLACGAAGLFEEEDDDAARQACDAPRGTDCYSARSRLPPQDVLRLYQITHIMTSLLQKHDVWHIASSGTLLGAVRNKGMIPHDDDVDFNILRDPGVSAVTSTSFRRDLSRNGLFLREIREVQSDFLQCADVEKPELRVDLFAMVERNGVLTFDDSHWPGSPQDIRATELPTSVLAAGGRVGYAFGAIMVWGPTRPVVEQYLLQKYGPEWATKINYTSFHDCVGIEDMHYDLTEPARPFQPLPIVVL